jgi:hypothetical protein
MTTIRITHHVNTMILKRIFKLVNMKTRDTELVSKLKYYTFLDKFYAQQDYDKIYSITIFCHVTEYFEPKE